MQTSARSPASRRKQQQQQHPQLPLHPQHPQPPHHHLLLRSTRLHRPQGNKFYIFVDGLIKVLKSVRGSTEQKLLSKYDKHTDRPWFGEIALWLNKARSGSAVVFGAPRRPVTRRPLAMRCEAARLSAC